MARRLIEAGANYDFRVEGINALIASCEFPETIHSILFVNYLLRSVRVKLSEDIGAQALISALNHRSEITARLLLANDVNDDIDLNRVYTNQSDTTILIASVSLCSAAYFQELLAFGADPAYFAEQSLFDKIKFKISNYLLDLMSCRLQAPGVERLFSDRSSVNSLVNEHYDADALANLVEMNNIVVQKLNSKLPTSYNDRCYFPLFIIKKVEEETLVLFIRNSKYKASNKGCWKLPKISHSAYHYLNLPSVYYFYLPNIYTSYLCHYQQALADGQIEASYEKTHDSVWISKNDLVKTPLGFQFQETPVCYADALVYQHFHKSNINPIELNKAILYKVLASQLLLMSYLDEDREEFHKFRAYGVNINKELNCEEKHYSFKRYTLFDYDVKYNQGKWSEFLTSLGAEAQQSNSNNEDNLVAGLDYSK